MNKDSVKVNYRYLLCLSSKHLILEYECLEIANIAIKFKNILTQEIFWIAKSKIVDELLSGYYSILEELPPIININKHKVKHIDGELELCMYLKDDTRIGSFACLECAHNTESEKNYIICDVIDYATGKKPC